MLAYKLLKRATKTANSRGNESRIAKQDSKIFSRIVETAKGKPANGEGYLYIHLRENIDYIFLFGNFF